MDSAFKIGTKEYLIKSSQEHLLDKRALLLNHQATSIRKLSEWGMRIIKGSFVRLKEPSLFEKMRDQQLVLRLIVHLYNFQTAQVRINHIMNSYMGKTGHFGGEAITENANVILECIKLIVIQIHFNY